MKIKALSVAVVILSVLFLCSFDRKNIEKDNISLHNSANTSLLNEETSRGGALPLENEDELSGIYDSFVEALPDGVPKSSSEVLGALGIEEVLGYVASYLSSEESVKTLLVFVAVGILLSVFELFSIESAALGSAAALMLCAPVIEELTEALFQVSQGIESMSALFSSLIPVLTALLTVGSGGTAAAVSGAGMSISLGLISGALSGCLLPLSLMMFSSSAAASLDTVGVTEGAVKGVKWLFGFLIGFSSLVIVGIFGAQTVIAVSADNLALKSAKYAVSGMIPVVGGAVSGALSALISGVKLLSATVGTVSVFALLFIVIAPLLKLLFLRLCLSVSITVASFSGGGVGAKLLSSLRSALDTLIAILVSSTLVYLLEIIIVTGSIRGAL